MLRHCFQTKNNLVRVRSSTVELFPNFKDLALALDTDRRDFRQAPFTVRAVHSDMQPSAQAPPHPTGDRE